MITLRPAGRPSREQITDEPELPFFKPFSKQEYCMGSKELPVIMQILLGWVRILLGSPNITFPHQKVETFLEVAIAHTPQSVKSLG